MRQAAQPSGVQELGLKPSSALTSQMALGKPLSPLSLRFLIYNVGAVITSGPAPQHSCFQVTLGKALERGKTETGLKGNCECDCKLKNLKVLVTKKIPLPRPPSSQGSFGHEGMSLGSHGG